MPDSLDILARLLAAEDHPHLAEEPEFAECLRALDESPELRRRFEEERAFAARHRRLVGLSGLAEESRARISAMVEAARANGKSQVILHPWSVRKQFAWAAALALLLAGMSVISSTIIQSHDKPNVIMARSPVDVFHAFVAHSARSGLDMQIEERDPDRLLEWLQKQRGVPVSLPAALRNRPGLGCAKVDSPAGEVSVVTLQINDLPVQLYTASAKRLRTPGVFGPQRLRIEGRQGLEWSDGTTLFLLITREPGQELPGDILL